MFELKCGDRTNEIIIDHLKISTKRNEVEELLKQIRFQSLQDKIDNYDKDNSVDNWELIEAGITLADEIYGNQITEDVANNMWFQWCVNHYNDDDFKVKSYQIAEDLMRKTKNDYREILNKVDSEINYIDKEYSSHYNVIEGTNIYFSLPYKKVNFGNELFCFPSLDGNAQIKVNFGLKGESYTDNISVGKMFVGMSLNDIGKRSTGFLKQEPADFFKKIDMLAYGEDILNEKWKTGKALEIGQISQVTQLDDRTTIIKFIYEEDLNEALEKEICVPNERIKDPLIADYKPKGYYFVRNMPMNGEEKLVPMFK